MGEARVFEVGPFIRLPLVHRLLDFHQDLPNNPHGFLHCAWSRQVCWVWLFRDIITNVWRSLLSLHLTLM